MEHCSSERLKTASARRNLVPLILHVEDNPGDVFLMNKIIRKSLSAAVECHVAETIIQARHISHTGMVPNLILLDLYLPDSFGEDTFLNIRALFPESPIIVLTGLDNDDIATSLIAKGARRVLNKNTLTDDIVSQTLIELVA